MRGTILREVAEKLGRMAQSQVNKKEIVIFSISVTMMTT